MVGKIIVRTLVIIVMVLSSYFTKAQEKVKITEEDYNNQSIEMADEFRANGKIYVLTGIILIVAVGMIVYLVMIDKKVTRLEKQLPNNDN